MEARRNTGYRAVVLRGLVHARESFFDDGVYLRDVAFLAALADLEDPGLRFLHQLLYILRLVKSLLFDLCGHGDEVAGGRFLRDDLCVIAKVCRRSYTTRQFGYIDHTAGFIQRAETAEFLTYRQRVNRLVFRSQLADSLKDHAVLVLIEYLRTQQICYRAVRIFLYHQRTEHRILEFRRLRG